MSEITLRQARKEYFESNGFPPDGGYEDKWIPLKFGWLTIYLYNFKSRKAAVPFHDIHHIVTGYKTDPIGEAELATWELAAGTHKKHFATLINIPGFLYGVALSTKRVFKAYVLGRNSSTFYSQDFSESLLDTTVNQAREALLPRDAPNPTLGNYLGFTASFLLTLGLFSWPTIICLLS